MSSVRAVAWHNCALMTRYVCVCLVSGRLHGTTVHSIRCDIHRHTSHKKQPGGNVSPVSFTLLTLKV